jgi:hypothetical protein
LDVGAEGIGHDEGWTALELQDRPINDVGRATGIVMFGSLLQKIGPSFLDDMPNDF